MDVMNMTVLRVGGTGVLSEAGSLSDLNCSGQRDVLLVGDTSTASGLFPSW